MNKPIYKRELSHSYLVICGIPQEERSRYPYRMVLKNRIPGLLSCSERFPEGEACLYYDISSRQSLGQLYESARIGYSQIRGLVDNLAQVQDTMAEYLLEESALILEPAYIYMDLETEQMFFLYYPFMEERKRGERLYLPVAEFLLEHVDHREERAVNAAYQFYKMSRAESFTIEGFRTLLERDTPQERNAFQGRGEALYAVAEEDGGYLYDTAASCEYRTASERNIIGQGIPEAYQENGKYGSGRYEGGRYEGGRCESERYESRKTGNGSCGEETASGAGDTGRSGISAEGGAAAGRRKRAGWIAGLLATGVIFAGLCVMIWYLQPAGWVKICLFAGLAADGIALLLFLWKTITEEGGGRKGTGETAEGGTDTVGGKSVEETAFYGTYEGPGGSFYENSCAETLLCGPTVFFGEGASEGEWPGRADQRPRPRLADPKEEGREYSLDRLLVMVGKMRSRAQILLADASVSRIHARFVEKEGRTALMDLNSTNGTYVNGIRLEQEETVLLKNNDEILFGNMELRYLE